MLEGVKITSGIKTWQIFQQIDGYAEICFDGYCEFNGIPNGSVYARIVDENTQSSIVTWTKAEMGENYKYKMIFKKVPVGGLYRIETSFSENDCYFDWAARGDMIFHVGVGDLYVIAGQSNSAGYGKTIAVDMPELGIHLYRNCENWDLATHPMNESTNTNHAVNAEGGNPGHSPYLAFAKKIKNAVNYPVGLLQTSLGGSAMHQWDASGKSNLYTNMVDVIGRATNGNMKIKGMLWYQGCSDTGMPNCDNYKEKFSDFVSFIRRDTTVSDLPILTVQLNKVLDGGTNHEANEGWGKIREAQRTVALNIPEVYVIPTMDLSLSDGIHNSTSSNIVIGERLATIALEKIYGFAHSNHGSAPTVEKAYFASDDTIKIEFNDVYQHIEPLTLALSAMPFTVICENEIIKVVGYSWWKNIAEIKIESSRDYTKKYFVHCAYGTEPCPNMPFDRGSGLPILAFHNIKINEIKVELSKFFDGDSPVTT